LNRKEEKIMTKFVSPNDLHRGACETMLDGREPQSVEDWQLCVNFWACNIALAEVQCCQLMARLYGCPLSDEQIVEIAMFQVLKKEEKE